MGSTEGGSASAARFEMKCRPELNPGKGMLSPGAFGKACGRAFCTISGTLRWISVLL
jgi:hypothetical protein